MKQDAKRFSNEKYFNGCQGKRDVNQNWNMINDYIISATNKFIPCKTTANKKHLLWVSKQIGSEIRRKDKIHKLAQQTCNPKLFNKWKSIRAEIKQDIKTAHDAYVNNLIGDISTDSKPFWKYINPHKNDRQGIPPLHTNNGSIAETDKAKADALNSQFTSVFTATEFDQIPFAKPEYNKMEYIKTRRSVTSDPP